MGSTAIVYFPQQYDSGSRIEHCLRCPQCNSRFGRYSSCHRTIWAPDWTNSAVEGGTIVERPYTIKAVARFWIVEFLHDVPNSAAVELSTYAFDPKSGAPLRKYFFPPDTGWGLACADGDDLTFIVADENDNRLTLVKLAPGAKSNQVGPRSTSKATWSRTPSGSRGQDRGGGLRSDSKLISTFASAG